MIGDYLKIPLDANKRHFVIGDIHGRYDGLMKLLESFNYDPTTDMIYAVGDMIDRGSNSVDVVRFFTEQANTYSILGNHEYMMLDSAWYDTWMSNGGLQTDESLASNELSRSWMTQKFLKMSMVLDVGDDSNQLSFRLVHAEIPETWNEDILLNNLLMMTKEQLSVKLQWSRKTLYLLENATSSEQVDEIVASIINKNSRRVFSGHTGVNNVVTFGNQTFLDTGFTKLSAINALTGDVFSVKSYL